jgi:hypothetical protein
MDLDAMHEKALEGLLRECPLHHGNHCLGRGCMGCRDADRATAASAEAVDAMAQRIRELETALVQQMQDLRKRALGACFTSNHEQGRLAAVRHRVDGAPATVEWELGWDSALLEVCDMIDEGAGQ